MFLDCPLTQPNSIFTSKMYYNKDLKFIKNDIILIAYQKVTKKLPEILVLIAALLLLR